MYVPTGHIIYSGMRPAGHSLPTPVISQILSRSADNDCNFTELKKIKMDWT